MAHGRRQRLADRLARWDSRLQQPRRPRNFAAWITTWTRVAILTIGVTLAVYVYEVAVGQSPVGALAPAFGTFLAMVFIGPLLFGLNRRWKK